MTTTQHIHQRIDANSEPPMVRPMEVWTELESKRLIQKRGGVSTGFERINEIWTVKKGFPVFIAGAPHSGKTQFSKQILVNLSVLHGWRHCVYFGEDGTADDIVLDLVECYTRKPARRWTDEGKEQRDALTDGQFHAAVDWINKHFTIVDTDRMAGKSGTFDVYQFYSWVDQYQREQGFTFDTTTIDPWNDLSMNLSGHGGRQDLYLADALRHVRDKAKEHHRVDFVINHIADQKTYHVSDRGRRYSPPAEPSEWAGGQTWHRRAFTMLLVYRPPAPDSIKFATRQKPIETKPGECWIVNQKAKPKGTGKLGRAVLYFDRVANCYHEFHENVLRYPYPTP